MAQALHQDLFQKLEEAVLQGLSTGNVGLIDSLLDEKFTAVGLLGISYTRAEFLAHVAQNISVRKIEIRSVHVVEENGFAVVLTEWTVDMNHLGAVVNGLVRVSRVWVLRGSSWKILSFHTSDARMGDSWMATKKKIVAP